MDNNQKKNNKLKYKNGGKYQYNRFEDTFGDAGRYSDETPRKRAFINNTHKIIFVIVVGLVTIGCIILGVLSTLGYMG